MPPLRSRWILAIAAAVVTSILFIDFCNLVYACGCRSLWAGADALCNVHHTHGPHCPWCAIGLAGSVMVWLTIVTAQAGIALRLPGEWIARVVATFAAFPVVGGTIAVAMGLAQGYWRP